MSYLKPGFLQRYIGILDRWLISLLFIAAIVLYAIFIYRSRFTIDGQVWFSLCDDAMISMTYGRNLAEGRGLAWNKWDEPVEGYTNFGWTLVMALVHFLPLRDGLTSLAVMLIGILTMVTTAVCSLQIAERFKMEGTGRAITTALTLCCFPLIFWSLRGLEVGMLACLSLVATLFALRQNLLVVACIVSTMLLVRTDAALSAAAISLLSIYMAPRDRRIMWAGVLFGAGVCTLGLHTGFRLWYYGDPLPNTYTLKVTGTPLFERVTAGWKALYHMRWQLIPLLAFVPWGFFSKGYLRTLLFWSFGTFLLQVMYSVYVGGDAWEAAGFLNRYITQGMPFLFLVVGAGMETCGRWLLNPKLIATVPTAVGLAFAAALIKPLDARFIATWLTENAYQVGQDAEMAKLGIHIRRATKPRARIAVVWAGAVPYFSHRAGVDLLGKMDRHIARLPPRYLGWFYPGHMKWDYDYSLRKYRPDVVHQLWFPSPEDETLLTDLGYVRAPNKIYYRPDSDLIDPVKLGLPVNP